MTADVSHRKRALRVELRERRRQLSVRDRAAATDALTRRLIDLATQLRVSSLSAYLPMPDEPDVWPFVEWANQQGIRVLVPVSRNDGLLDWTVEKGRGQTEGIFGLPEPIGEVLGPIAINDVDLIIVPAACVDRTGMRMGWGRGYFDRTLGSMDRCPPVYAVVFDNEVLDYVPSEVHDKRIDGVVTPSATVRF